MAPRRILAVLLIALGALAVIAGPWLPGAQRLAFLGPPSKAHVTALAEGDAQAILAATQGGEIWRYEDGGWTQMELELEGRVITALVGEPGRYPVGTATGLWPEFRESLAGSPRVLDILKTEDALLVATADGVRVFSEEAWHEPGPQVNAYRLHAQQHDGIRYLHAGTIGDGVYSIEAEGMLDGWQRNNAGLPVAAKVLSFAVTEGGLLLAGTDSGLYWQARPGEDWQALDTGLDQARILALDVERSADGGVQRLWIGTDDGLATIELTEDSEGLAAVGPVYRLAVQETERRPRVAVGEVLRVGERLVVSAGDVYELKTVRHPSWYLLSLAGFALVILGAWIGLRRPNEGTTGD